MPAHAAEERGGHDRGARGVAEPRDEHPVQREHAGADEHLRAHRAGREHDARRGRRRGDHQEDAEDDERGADDDREGVVADHGAGDERFTEVIEPAALDERERAQEDEDAADDASVGPARFAHPPNLRRVSASFSVIRAGSRSPNWS